MEEKSTKFLEAQPVGRLMAAYAVPCVISLLVAALYNISVAVMIGDGCCAFVSISLGAPFYMFGQAMNPIIRSDGSPNFAMAVLEIVMKFFQIVISIAVGLAAGCIPVVGHNIGAVVIVRTYRVLGKNP